MSEVSLANLKVLFTSKSSVWLAMPNPQADHGVGLCNPFYVVNAAKSKAVQEDIQPFSKAGRFTMRFPSIFFALDPFPCRQNVIDMEAEDTINHVAVALVLEHFKWVSPLRVLRFLSSSLRSGDL